MKHNYNAKRVGLHIRELRKSAGWSQSKLAEELNMSADSRQLIAKWESGQGLPPLDRLIELCELFDCDIGYMMGDYEQRCRTIADVCEYVGLSEAAVDRLHYFADINNVRADFFRLPNIISLLVESWQFAGTLKSVSAALSLYSAAQAEIDDSILDDLTGKDYLDAEETINATGQIMLPFEDSAEFYTQKAALQFAETIKSIAAGNDDSNKT